MFLDPQGPLVSSSEAGLTGAPFSFRSADIGNDGAGLWVWAPRQLSSSPLSLFLTVKGCGRENTALEMNKLTQFSQRGDELPAKLMFYFLKAPQAQLACGPALVSPLLGGGTQSLGCRPSTEAWGHFADDSLALLRRILDVRSSPWGTWHESAAVMNLNPLSQASDPTELIFHNQKRQHQLNTTAV